MLALQLLLGFSAAGGMLLIVSATQKARPRVQLTAPDERPFLARSLETFFVPAGKRVANLGRHDWPAQRQKLALRIAQAGYPPPFTSPESVLGYRLFTAAIFAGLVGLFGLILSLFSTGLGAIALPLAVGAGVLGWFMPHQVISNAIQERQEQLTLDAAATLDRLALYVAAGYALPMALRLLSERPGGAWVAEMRAIASDYAVTGDFPGALDKAAERCGHLPEIVRVTERLKAAYEMGGGGIVESLRRMAQDARERIKNLLMERGYKNAVLMVIPAFFAIVAIALVLIAPGGVQMLQVLGGA
jgi:Flp pilus assembly protein TadB